MKVRGFTIAEALIVLAIIAIMSYLLFPLFMKVKRYGQIYSSASKLRQIHVVIENYRRAWDGADVFTSYRSYYRVGLPPAGVEGRIYTRPWWYFSPDTTWKDWLSGCVLSTDYRINAVLHREHFDGIPSSGTIGFISLVQTYDPKEIETGNTRLIDYLPTYRQNAVVALDPYCNPLRTNMTSPLGFKRGLSLLLSGQVVNKYAQGSTIDLRWWSDPPED